MTAARYVVGFLVDLQGDVLLVRKLKPAWQAGLLNGVGGKIEPGETPLEAMAREWQEETGSTRPEAWRQFARMHDAGDAAYDVYFFKAWAPELPTVPEVNDRGEPLERHSRFDVVTWSDVISNLRWLLPLAFDDRGNPTADVVDPDLPEASPTRAAAEQATGA
jgi:8-oxo-dGTP diphosphatase